MGAQSYKTRGKMYPSCPTVESMTSIHPPDHPHAPRVGPPRPHSVQGQGTRAGMFFVSSSWESLSDHGACRSP